MVYKMYVELHEGTPAMPVKELLARLVNSNRGALHTLESQLNLGFLDRHSLLADSAFLVCLKLSVAVGWCGRRTGL